MEYCEGGDLFEGIDSSHAFSEARAKKLFKSMVLAVMYCH